MNSLSQTIFAAAADEAEWIMKLQQPVGGCCYCHRKGSPSVDAVGAWAHIGHLCSDHRNRVPEACERAEDLVERITQSGKEYVLDRALRRRGPYLRNPTTYERMRGAPEDSVVLAVRRDGTLRLVSLELDFAVGGQDLASAMPYPPECQIDRGLAMSVWATAAKLGKCKKKLLAVIREEARDD